MCSFELRSSTQSSAWFVYSQISTPHWTDLWLDVFIWVKIIYPIITLVRLFWNQHHKLNWILMICVHLSWHHLPNHHLSSSILESAPQTELNSGEICLFPLSSSMQLSPSLIYSQISTRHWTELLLDVFIWVVIIYPIITLVRLFSNQNHKLNRILVRCVHLSRHYPCNHQLGSSIFRSAPHTEQNYG